MGATLYRYIFKEQLIPFALSAFGISFVLVAGRLLQLARYLFTSSLSFMDLMELMALALPKLLLYTLPMAALMGTVLAFVRMSGDNELTALHSAGISFHQLLPPVLTLVLAVTGLSYANTLLVVHNTNQAFETKLKSLGRATIPLLMREGVFIDAVPNLVFFFRSADPSNLSIHGFFVEDQRNPAMRATIVAQEADINVEEELDRLVFRVRNGIITRIPEDHKSAQAVSFKKYDLILNLDEILGGSKQSMRNRNHMSAPELLRRAQQETTSRREEASFLLEFHRRLALPFSCLILGLLGAPLGVVSRQKSRITGIALGLAIFLGYYVLLTAFKGLGENLVLPASLAAWGPNMACTALAVYLWARTRTPTAAGTKATNIDLLKNALFSLTSRFGRSQKKMP